MEEEKSILDRVYKVCKTCGQNRTLRNFQLNEKAKHAGSPDIRDLFSDTCRCCEKHPEFQNKKKRIETISEKLARFKKNAAARERKEYISELDREEYIKPE